MDAATIVEVEVRLEDRGVLIQAGARATTINRPELIRTVVLLIEEHNEERFVGVRVQKHALRTSSRQMCDVVSPVALIGTTAVVGIGLPSALQHLSPCFL